MRASSHDIKEWVTLAMPPVDSNDNCFVFKEMVLSIIDAISNCSKERLELIPDYHVARHAILEDDVKQRQSEENRRRLEAYDHKTSWDWRATAGDMVAQCENLISFIDKHRQFLEGNETHVNDNLDLYR